MEGVAVTSASNAWAVGAVLTSDGPQPILLHWNGSGWATVAAPSLGGSEELAGVAARSSGNVWAVGDFVVNRIAGGTSALAIHCC
jgi:hypothetical protein